MNDIGSGMIHPQLPGSVVSSVLPSKNPYATALSFSPPKPYAPPRYHDIVKPLKSKETFNSNTLASSSDTDSIPVLKKSNSSDSIMNCGLYTGDHTFYPPLLAGNLTQNSTIMKDVSFFKSSAGREFRCCNMHLVGDGKTAGLYIYIMRSVYVLDITLMWLCSSGGK